MHRASRRRLGRTRLTTAVGLLASLLLTGCAAGAEPEPTSSSASTAEPSPSEPSDPSPTAYSSPGFEFTDAVGRTFTLYSATASDVAVGSVVTYVTVQLRAPSESVLLATPQGSAWEIFADASAILREPEAQAGMVGGLLVPEALDAGGARTRARLADPRHPTPNSAGDPSVASDPAVPDGQVTTVEVWVEANASTVFPVEVRLELGVSALERVAWAEDLEGGRSLRVIPTRWGRSGSQAAVVAVWDGVIGLEPEAETEVMHKQLRCHALGAANKPSWNLEPWRPDVSYLDYLLSKCNPV